MQQFLLRQWQKRGLWAWMTTPLAGLVCLLAYLKRKAYEGAYLKQKQLSVPLIVVGNLSVGGSGKTPLVAHLAKYLQQQGYRPGILCRGYKGEAEHWPQLAESNSDPRLLGDEAVMLATQTSCPVMAGPDRALSAQTLIEQHGCDLIVSDDGFQHLKLARDLDIVVIDSQRGLGNRWCLPSGPLREGLAALRSANMLVIHGEKGMMHPLPGQHTRHSMQLIPGTPYRLADRSPANDQHDLKQNTLHAIAGIGHPQRFFVLLRDLGFTIIEHAFTDHHAYSEADLQFSDSLALITTEKDAIKLAQIETDQAIWVLPVVATLEAAFDTAVLEKLSAIGTQI